MADTLWEFSGISLGRGRSPRLNQISLTVSEGVTAVIGPSGAGKTSLLNLLVDFETPDEGSLTTNLPIADRLPLGWVPPDFGLWPHLNVREHLQTVQPPGRSATDVEELLDAFGLNELSSAAVSRLSQGERSRLAVARALCSDPAVLVLDEPLVHVDPLRLDRYWQTIREHCRERGTSLVFSTHSPETVLREASHVICLDDGRVSFEGTVEILYERPPTPRLARLLGPANWFTAEEISRWLPEPRASAEAVCIRPERLELVPANEDGLRVLASRSVGCITESELEHKQNGGRRTIIHRSGTDPVAIGTAMLLRVCALLLLCGMWSGCSQSDAGPELPVRSSRTFKMPADGSSVPAPRSLTVSPEGELYVLDNAGRVLVYATDGTLDRQWRMPEYDVGKPEGLCILSDGAVAVADTHYHRVVVFDRDGEVLRMFGELGEGPGQFIYPVAITKDESGHVYVAEYGGNDRIQKFTESGKFVTTFGSFGTEEGQFQRPSGVVWDDNTVYVADAINNRVHVFADDGDYQRAIVDAAQETSVSVDYPYDIALGPDDSLLLVEYGAGRVTQLTREGALMGRYGDVGRGEKQFYTPWGIAADRRGHVYVADTGNHRTVELSL